MYKRVAEVDESRIPTGREFVMIPYPDLEDRPDLSCCRMLDHRASLLADLAISDYRLEETVSEDHAYVPAGHWDAHHLTAR